MISREDLQKLISNVANSQFQAGQQAGYLQAAIDLHFPPQPPPEPETIPPQGEASPA